MTGDSRQRATRAMEGYLASRKIETVEEFRDFMEFYDRTVAAFRESESAALRVRMEAK